ncbi:atos homolog protein A isoform X3 [Equus caballus]|uniref:atos homolog protein A isoform X3 n=1 Tax=Equus caballus TaxID=9796 RepID=UPI0004BD5EC7|nr:PREDICTED: protein FAM214A isoform X1 [Equus przewalskii]XP_008514469.1 PREDICTED: protein FAM214A isoform X1 [Equus przewalskii]XP_008514470.1 PREDICTED: protein FAM214A isoform X1 [Equus przewalskii]XP_008514471.1 PREDICTED: protein FAM214A isoform X1 [Equus przewalskii]XP_008514472.1 PREDICTED: protein FAM214A isoform X1 [Equus przewalskii]XP_023472952.1 protein FAM214A isoform X3 [Equus caballus]XP_023472958.1 protein FAM214A isoform X3 [Equus caballus]XP_023472967.1 protein FAM214A i
MKPDRDTLDEYFEYDAEEFLVSLALLITEGRTPECSVKGRTESFHCPPAQSCYPVTTKHECSDKLAQCRQARRTRSEVTLLWKNNLPIMVEVMLLPDCCYSDDGPTTEGIDLHDPAIKQDALLLERWRLEPVPRQSGDRFIEEKTLLLAVRSFVFFSQLSAWLSVSHGAIPRNILYRISAADVDLQWNFSQTPIEHVFPVPNVSHNVALKVSVQSLPRQSNYPVLTCSIHANIGLYEKRIQDHELKTHQHRGSNEAEQCGTNSSQRLCSKQTWTLAPESVLHAKNGTTPEYTAAVKNVKLYPGTGSKSDYGTSQASILGFSGVGDKKSQETSVRTLKSFSMIDSSVSSRQSSWQSVSETNPLIGSLIQERQEVIARIAQHLIHCDPSTSHVSGHPFNAQESSSLNSRFFRVSQENENVRRCKEAFSISFGSPELTSSEDTNEGKIRVKPETPRSEGCISNGLYSRQPVGETNPLIDSLFQERQDVIARIAQHLEHIDPAASHMPRQSFKMHDSSSLPSKVFRSSYEDKNLLKKNKDYASVSISNAKFSLLEDSSEGKNLIPNKSFSSFKCSSKAKSSLKPQTRHLYQDNPGEIIQSTCQETQSKATSLLTPSNMSHCKENNLDLTIRLENTLSECQFKEQEISNGIDKQYSYCNGIDKQICANKCKEKIIINENCNPESFNNHQFDNSKKNDLKMKVTMLKISGYLNKHENKCSNKDSKRPNTQLNSIENYLNKDNESFKCKKPDQLKNEQDKKEDPTDEKSQNCSQRKSIKDCLSTCERLKNTEVLQRTIPLKHSSVWQKHNFHSLDGISTRAFHPRTGLPLLSSPVPQRKTQSGCFDLDSSLLHLKSLSSRSPRPCLNIADDPNIHERPFLSSSAPPITSLSLLGNFEESVLNYRLDPLGIVDGFTAEVGASGVFCPTHLTLPVEVSFYSVSDDNAPSPYMGVITLESLGKRGYRVPPSGTIQVTLFNPNKTVVKMFVVIYDLRDMPANHQTFLRQRTFSVPVKQEMKRSVNKENIRHTEERLLRYLIHLRFQSSKSGKIYLHRDVRLLFSRKSMEVDSGAAYELKSYTESPTNPQFSPRC